MFKLWLQRITCTRGVEPKIRHWSQTYNVYRCVCDPSPFSITRNKQRPCADQWKRSTHFAKLNQTINHTSRTNYKFRLLVLIDGPFGQEFTALSKRLLQETRQKQTDTSFRPLVRVVSRPDRNVRERTPTTRKPYEGWTRFYGDGTRARTRWPSRSVQSRSDHPRKRIIPSRRIRAFWPRGFRSHVEGRFPRLVCSTSIIPIHATRVLG